MHKDTTSPTTAKKTRKITPKEILHFWQNTTIPNTRRALFQIKNIVDQATDSGQKSATVPLGTLKSLLVQMDRTQGMAEMLREALDLERIDQEQHPEAIRRALELDAVPFAEYASLAADYVRLSKALDRAEKNLKEIAEAWDHASKLDNEILLTLIKNKK
jgi:hypothetical protein